MPLGLNGQGDVTWGQWPQPASRCTHPSEGLPLWGHDPRQGQGRALEGDPLTSTALWSALLGLCCRAGPDRAKGGEPRGPRRRSRRR